MSAEQEIVQIIQKLSGKYSPDMVFADWVEMSAISIQNACYMLKTNLWKKREAQYMAIAKKYEAKEINGMTHMLGLLTTALEEETTDWLGKIYMESGCGSKQTGQFFTPFHVSELTAKMSIPMDISIENKLVMNEPSVGGGGMIIAAAKTLKERGLNYQKCMVVTAQDLDWRSVYMAYIQFSLLGINAEVVQGNTLSEQYVQGMYPEECVFKTPARMGMLI